MTTTHGNGGVLKVAANTIAEVKNYEITEGIATADDTAMGDPADTHLPGSANWTASLAAHWDPDDVNGQEALTIGASVTFNTFPQGDTTGDRTASGTATVTGITVNGDRADVVERSIELLGNGALAWSDVP